METKPIFHLTWSIAKGKPGETSTTQMTPDEKRPRHHNPFGHTFRLAGSTGDPLRACGLYTLLTGKTINQVKCPERVHCLMNSFAQDIIYVVSGVRQKSPKQVLLPCGVKKLTNNVELIQMINRCGYGIAYSQIEEISTALCLQKNGLKP